MHRQNAAKAQRYSLHRSYMQETAECPRGQQQQKRQRRGRGSNTPPLLGTQNNQNPHKRESGVQSTACEKTLPATNLLQGPPASCNREQRTGLGPHTIAAAAAENLLLSSLQMIRSETVAKLVSRLPSLGGDDGSLLCRSAICSHSPRTTRWPGPPEATLPARTKDTSSSSSRQGATD